MPLLVLLSGPPTSQPDYSFLNLILMASYVGLTLILAIVAIVSIVISSRLSRKALKDSEKQSKDAIDAVQKQIDASKEQTKDTIDAINRQIQASEKQAQEALYNQHKPVIVPLTNPISRDGNIFEVNMQNKGSGVALNTFCLLTISGLTTIMCTNKVFFLVPDKVETILFSLDHKETLFSYNEFEGYKVFSSEARFMVTYNDAFANKYLAVFDWSSVLGWRQIDQIKRVEQRLDEQIIIKH